jgi:hypothetical protein
MTAFNATHVIKIKYAGKEVEIIPVMRHEGGLYQYVEWINALAADWEVDEAGNVYFQGSVPVCEYYNLFKALGK